MTKPKRYSFTLNNPTGPSMAQLQKLANMNGMAGSCWQLERGVSGTYHLQGYLYYSPGISRKQIAKLVEGILVDGYLDEAYYNWVHRMNRIRAVPIYIESGDDSGEETVDTVILSDNE